MIKQKKGKIAVIGAGAFGGWTAFHLLTKGYDVTLMDVLALVTHGLVQEVIQE